MDPNLPINQNQQDNNGQTPTTPAYGLDFQPQAPTNGEAVPVVENHTEQTPQQTETISELQKPKETLITPEIETPIPMPTAAQLQDTTTPIVVPISDKIEPAKVVDQTETLTTLHHVVDTLDEVTKIADQDEEKFIQEVEKHHGHQ